MLQADDFVFEVSYLLLWNPDARTVPNPDSMATLAEARENLRAWHRGEAKIG